MKLDENKYRQDQQTLNELVTAIVIMTGMSKSEAVSKASHLMQYNGETLESALQNLIKEFDPTVPQELYKNRAARRKEARLKKN